MHESEIFLESRCYLAENPAVKLLECSTSDLSSGRHILKANESFKETIPLPPVGPEAAESLALRNYLPRHLQTVTHVAASSLAEANEKVYTSLTYGDRVGAGSGRRTEKLIQSGSSTSTGLNSA